MRGTRSVAQAFGGVPEGLGIDFLPFVTELRCVQLEGLALLQQAKVRLDGRTHTAALRVHHHVGGSGRPA